MSERRQFTHLSKAEIREIARAYYADKEPKASIAKRLTIDVTTVGYHLRKYEKSYPENPSIYSVVRIEHRKECTHPSVKCMLCGLAEDNIRTHEREQISTLTARLHRANERLQRHGFEVE